MFNDISKISMILVLTICFVLGGSLFPFSLGINKSSSLSVLAAQEKSKTGSAKTSRKSNKKNEKSKNVVVPSEVSDEDDYLQEPDSAKGYLPDIYRCPECSYEQDLPGTCPDHATIELILIQDKARNPYSPTEYDGNEDILVDIPLKNLVFKKEILEQDEKKKLDKPETENK